VVTPKSNNPILQMDFKAAATKEERLEATRHLVKAFGQKKGQRLVNKKVLQCCGSVSGIRCLFDSWMGKKTGSGSWMINPDHISESLETIFWGYTS
jgi:hypothetical protein